MEEEELKVDKDPMLLPLPDGPRMGIGLEPVWRETMLQVSDLTPMSSSRLRRQLRLGRILRGGVSLLPTRFSSLRISLTGGELIKAWRRRAKGTEEE